MQILKFREFLNSCRCFLVPTYTYDYWTDIIYTHKTTKIYFLNHSNIVKVNYSCIQKYKLISTEHTIYDIPLGTFILYTCISIGKNNNNEYL